MHVQYKNPSVYEAFWRAMSASRPKAPIDSAAGNPTYRIADLSNPIFKPWAIEQMKCDNDEVLAGKIPFTAKWRFSACSKWKVLLLTAGKVAPFPR